MRQDADAAAGPSSASGPSSSSDPPTGRAARFGIGAVGLCCALAGAGCVPLWAYRVYEPDAPGGTAQRNACRGTYDEVAIRHDAIEVRARVVRRDVDHDLIELALLVPEGHQVRLDEPRVHVFDAADELRDVSRFPGIAAVQTPAAHLIPWTATMKGETFSAGPRDVRRRYWMYAPLDLGDAKAFSVVLPALDIDGRRAELPVIRFTRRTRWQFFAPLRC